MTQHIFLMMGYLMWNLTTYFKFRVDKKIFTIDGSTIVQQLACHCMVMWKQQKQNNVHVTFVPRNISSKRLVMHVHKHDLIVLDGMPERKSQTKHGFRGMSCCMNTKTITEQKASGYTKPYLAKSCQFVKQTHYQSVSHPFNWFTVSL